MPDAPPHEPPIVRTRLAWQAVAEHVLSAARHAATGRIGLRPAPGGFATPAYPSGHGERTLAVAGNELVRTDDRGEVRAPLTTVADAARLAEVAAGAPRSVYTPATPLLPDEPLFVDPGSAAVLADWWALVDEALGRFAAAHAHEGPTEAQLWPEHFDLGLSLGEVNYGGSPGDGGDPLPYLYVGPWSPRPHDVFWNRSFGAAIAAAEIGGVDEAVAFLEEGRRRALASG
jgi:hypothetical protein